MDTRKEIVFQTAQLRHFLSIFLLNPDNAKIVQKDDEHLQGNDTERRPEQCTTINIDLHQIDDTEHG